VQLTTKSEKIQMLCTSFNVFQEQQEQLYFMSALQGGFHQAQCSSM